MYKKSAKLVWNDIRTMLTAFILPTIFWKAMDFISSALQEIEPEEITFFMEGIFQDTY